MGYILIDSFNWFIYLLIEEEIIVSGDIVNVVYFGELIEKV